MMDYVQMIDELLPAIDAYWKLDGRSTTRCWDPSLNGADENLNARSATSACLGYFGTYAQQSPRAISRSSRRTTITSSSVASRVVGPTTSREVIYTDPSNAPYLKLARCCFHHQVNFAVRAGSEWVTTGSVLGLMSHMTTEAATNRCVPSCNPRDQLLNSRAPSLPYGDGDFAPFRDTPLAMRNPAFSFFVQNGYTIVTDSTNKKQFGQAIDTPPTRDTFYHFQSRGQFTPLIVDLTQGNSANTVDPQSMRFIDPLGQVAVVDGSAQGLILIDLSLVAIARAPYF